MEIRRGDGSGSGGGGHRPAFGERLPWLEPVEEIDEDEAYGAAGGYGGVIVAGIAVLLLIALATGAVLWFRHHQAATADVGQIIRAEPGPYKIKPQDPGGMKPDMSERVAAGTGAGQDVDAVLDPSAMPEAAMVGPRGQAQATAPAPAPVPATPQRPQAAPPTALAQAPTRPLPAPTPAPAPVAKVPPAPATPPVAEAPVGPGGAIQLGAFSSEAKAKAAWKAMSSRFDYLKDMTPVIGQVKTGAGMLWRLRATGGTAGSPASICGRLKLAGDTCAVIGG